MMTLALACIAIASVSDHVTAGDLGFAGADPATPVALAPVPGVQRVFRAAELQRLAARFQATAPDRELCVERKSAPVDRARVLDAMRRELPDANIEILETSRYAAPEGDVEFPMNGLRQTPAGGFWVGYVRYAGNRRFAIWAKVKVSVSASRVIAVGALKPGQPIDAAQLRVEVRDNFPSGNNYVGSTNEIAGKVPRRPIAAGAVIQRQWLEASKDVARGDSVRVEVRSGAAFLEFEGEAQSGGSAGQEILVLNPASKKRFQARIEGKGKVIVTEPRPPGSGAER